jgi:hypothetical protein
MVTHKVRSWNYLFEPMRKGLKTHDLRKNDRDFKVGDRLLLQEYDQTLAQYTGRELLMDITYITGRLAVPCAVSTAVLHEDYVILAVVKSPEIEF